MSEKKRFDEFEIDVDELESVAGGALSSDFIHKVLKKINERQREIDEKVHDIKYNMNEDLRLFLGKDVTEEEVKKFFEEKYDFTF